MEDKMRRGPTLKLSEPQKAHLTGEPSEGDFYCIKCGFLWDAFLAEGTIIAPIST